MTINCPQNSGLIVPYEIGVSDIGSDRVRQWTIKTFTYFKELHECVDIPNEEVGINLFNGKCIY